MKRPRRCTKLVYGHRCNKPAGHDEDHRVATLGPTFIPFEQMTPADKLAHLAFMHGQVVKASIARHVLDSCHRAEHAYFEDQARPHTHDRAVR